MKNKILNFSHKKFSIFSVINHKIGGFLMPKNSKMKTLPSFQHIDDNLIKSTTGIDPVWTYRNNIIWTPRFYLQKDISPEFLFQLKKFKKIDKWDDLHLFSLVQLILTEAIRDTSYEIAYNYKIEPSYYNPLWGTIDALIYNTEEGSK